MKIFLLYKLICFFPCLYSDLDNSWTDWVLHFSNASHRLQVPLDNFFRFKIWDGLGWFSTLTYPFKYKARPRCRGALAWNISTLSTHLDSRFIDLNNTFIIRMKLMVVVLSLVAAGSALVLPNGPGNYIFDRNVLFFSNFNISLIWKFGKQ